MPSTSKRSLPSSSDTEEAPVHKPVFVPFFWDRSLPRPARPRVINNPSSQKKQKKIASGGGVVTTEKEKDKKKKKKDDQEKERKKPPRTAPSSWRESKVPVEAKITGLGAQQQYKLGRAAYQHLRYETYQVRDKNRAPAHLYSEREVEQLAWIKHGSPEGWEYYLNQLRSKFIPKIGAPFFIEPQKYGDPSIPISITLHQPIQATLTLLKSQFPHSWLYEACESHLRSTKLWALSQTHLFNALSFAQQTWFQDLINSDNFEYPDKPSQKELELLSFHSESLKKLKKVLGKAARIERGEDGDIVEDGIEVNEDEETGEKWFTWSLKFETKVWKALVEVEKELGKEGWEEARWEVSKVHSETSFLTSGIVYHEEADPYWEDNSVQWLMRSEFDKILSKVVV